MSRFLEVTKLHKVIPVIAINDSSKAIELGKVLKENGLPVAEIVLRTPEALNAIRLMKEHHPDLYVGAGTVKNAHDVDLAVEAGSDFIVSPAMNPNTVKRCAEVGIEIVAGINNPTDIETGLELGLTTFKFFPAEASGGASMIKALVSPYSEISIMPTGGITKDNIGDYLSIKNVVCCGGTWFINADLIDNEDWDTLGNNIREAVALVSEYL